ncbi:MAG: MaoC/PaaZ C-terminal domain-containing protein [Dehalococcoidia bacterium]
MPVATVNFKDIEVGTEIPSIVKPAMTRVQIAKYAGASGDFNPLHVDEIYATTQSRMKSVIAHGMLSMGFLGQLLTTWLGSPLPLRTLDVRFQSSVYPGDVITLSGTVTSKEEKDGATLVHCDLRATNQDGTVVTSGIATVDLSAQA